MPCGVVDIPGIDGKGEGHARKQTGPKGWLWRKIDLESDERTQEIRGRLMHTDADSP